MACQSATCTHPSLYLDTGDYATRYGYTRPSEQKRISAEKLPVQSGGRVGGSSSKSQPKSSTTSSTAVSRSTFPGPLLLPGDDLSTDPKYPAQSVRQWAQDEDRNPVTPERNIVYVAAPPTVDDSVKVMAGWIPPSVPTKPKSNTPTDDLKPPATTDIIEYLTAYYHGITVKPLPQALRFTSWTPKPSPAPKHVGLALSTGECVRIRTRASHDGHFSRQLNLNDLLDGAIDALPADAYALLMIVDHDIYEDEDDDFACGRAYGGSRVAVVSSARYHPKLDGRAGVDRDHAWPAAHCTAYVDRMRAEADEEEEEEEEPPRKKAKTQKKKSNKPSTSTSTTSTSTPSTNTLASTDASPSPSPLTRALNAHASLTPTPSLTSHATYSGLWLGRVCKTAAHELGHCFGMDHCVYYACAMQGTASLAEDARQPPYLCPVDLAKMTNATGADVVERYEKIQGFCEKRMGEVHLFAAFHAWIAGRLEELASGAQATDAT